MGKVSDFGVWNILLLVLNVCGLAAIAASGSYGLLKFVDQQRGHSAVLVEHRGGIASIIGQVGDLRGQVGDLQGQVGNLQERSAAQLGRTAAQHAAVMARIQQGETDRAGLRQEILALRQTMGTQLEELAKSQVAARAAGSCVEIERVPFVIESSGSYCLSARRYNASAGRFAIAIEADGVDLDLRGAVLEGPHRNDRLSEGIYSSGHVNLTVRNGTVVGFMYGVRIDPPLEDRAYAGTIALHDLTVIDSSFRGIAIDPGEKNRDNTSVTIADTIISRVGGTSVFDSAFAMGLDVSNVASCRIARNRVFDLTPGDVGEGVGLALGNNHRGCVIEQNHFVNSGKSEWGRTYGLWSDSNRMQSFLFRDNFISNFTYAFSAHDKAAVMDNALSAIECTPSNAAAYYSSLQKSRNQWLDSDEVCTDTYEHFAGAALAGDRRAQYRIAGTRLGIADPVKRQAEMIRWLTLAAEQGLPIARRQLEAIRRAEKGR